MPGKYEPLAQALHEAAGRGQQTLELEFDAIAALVGGLPPSAAQRQWWANSSHSQALAWRSAGFHVEQVHLDRRRVRFARGERGGTYHDRGGLERRSSGSEVPAERAPVGAPVEVCVTVQWRAGGRVRLDGAGKPAFAPLGKVPGLYRLTLTAGADGARARVYIGETDNLRRRLAVNYRSPGPRQLTSLRINALMLEHLAAGGVVDVAVALAATVWLCGAEQPLDSTRKAGRSLAESAALVLAQVTDDADIVNLG